MEVETIFYSGVSAEIQSQRTAINVGRLPFDFKSGGGMVEALSLTTYPKGYATTSSMRHLWSKILTRGTFSWKLAW